MLVRPGADAQDWHLDDQNKFYWTAIIPITMDTDEMGGTEFEDGILNERGSMVLFNGNVEHRGTANTSDKVRCFLFVAFYVGSDANEDDDYDDDDELGFDVVYDFNKRVVPLNVFDRAELLTKGQVLSGDRRAFPREDKTTAFAVPPDVYVAARRRANAYHGGQYYSDPRDDPHAALEAEEQQQSLVDPGLTLKEVLEATPQVSKMWGLIQTVDTSKQFQEFYLQGNMAGGGTVVFAPVNGSFKGVLEKSDREALMLLHTALEQDKAVLEFLDSDSGAKCDIKSLFGDVNLRLTKGFTRGSSTVTCGKYKANIIETIKASNGILVLISGALAHEDSLLPEEATVGAPPLPPTTPEDLTVGERSDDPTSGSLPYDDIEDFTGGWSDDEYFQSHGDAHNASATIERVLNGDFEDDLSSAIQILRENVYDPDVLPEQLDRVLDFLETVPEDQEQLSRDIDELFEWIEEFKTQPAAAGDDDGEPDSQGTVAFEEISPRRAHKRTTYPGGGDTDVEGFDSDSGDSETSGNASDATVGAGALPLSEDRTVGDVEEFADEWSDDQTPGSKSVALPLTTPEGGGALDPHGGLQLPAFTDLERKRAPESEGEAGIPSRKRAALDPARERVAGGNDKPIELDDDDSSPKDDRVKAAKHSYSQFLLADQARYKRDKHFGNLPGGAQVRVCWAWEPITTRLDKDEVVATFEQSFECTREDMRTLQGKEWLNDKVINYYMALVEAENNKRVWIPSSHFYSGLVEGKDLHRWGTKVQRDRECRLKDLRAIIVPINYSSTHWACGVIALQSRQVCLYDSLGGSSENFKLFYDLMLAYLRDFNINIMSYKQVGSTTKIQTNHHDCGVFASLYARRAALGEDLPIQQADMQYWRRRMAYEILTANLVRDRVKRPIDDEAGGAAPPKRAKHDRIKEDMQKQGYAVVEILSELQATILRGIITERLDANLSLAGKGEPVLFEDGFPAMQFATLFPTKAQDYRDICVMLHKPGAKLYPSIDSVMFWKGDEDIIPLGLPHRDQLDDTPEQSFQAMLLLTDQNETTGGLAFLPRDFEPKPGQVQTLEGNREILTYGGASSKVVEAKAGCMIIWDSIVWHHGKRRAKKAAKSPRLSMLLAFNPPGDGTLGKHFGNETFKLFPSSAAKPPPPNGFTFGRL